MCAQTEHQCLLEEEQLPFVRMKMKQVMLAFRCLVEQMKCDGGERDRVGDAELKERNHLSKRSN